MLISSEYNFIFIHIPKTAGNSIEETLVRATFPFSKKLNWEIDSTLKKLDHRFEVYLGYNFNLRNPLYNDPWQKVYDQVKTKHARANQIKRALGADTYDNFFSFAFVRNPWSRLVSEYEYIRQTRHHRRREYVISLGSFEAFLEDKLNKSNDINQTKWLLDNNQNMIVNYVGKLESIEQDFSFICNKLNIPEKFILLEKNKSLKYDGDSYRDYYTEKTRQWVYDNAKKDIEIFGYTF